MKEATPLRKTVIEDASYAFNRVEAPDQINAVDVMPLTASVTNQEIQGKPQEVVILPTESVADNNIPAPTEPNDTKSVVTDIIKAGLWGSSDYPEDNYVLALAEKGVNNLSKNRDADVALSVTERDESGIHLKLGKFEFSSTRGRNRK